MKKVVNYKIINLIEIYNFHLSQSVMKKIKTTYPELALM